MSSVRWPAVLAVANILMFGVSVVMVVENEPDAVLVAVTLGGSVVSFSLVGALLISRVPGNRIGYLLLGSATMLSLAVGSEAYLALDDVPARGTPGMVLAGFINQTAFVPPIVLVFMGVPLLFPDGRLLSPRWRWLVALAVIAVMCISLATLFRAGPIGETDVTNPLGVPGLEPVLDAMEAFANPTSIIGFGGAALAVALRYRRGSPIERQRPKWLLAVAAVGAVAFTVAFTAPGSSGSDVGFIVGMAALAMLPVAIGIAILRYRLYDIDRIISRTLAYGLVTAVLVVVFAALVLGLQTVLAPLTRENTIAVAVSTLVVFALFQPLRRGVQKTVDRRFHRARIDAERTTEAFAGRLRDQLDLDALARELTVTAEGALRPSATGVWLRSVRR